LRSSRNQPLIALGSDAPALEHIKGADDRREQIIEVVRNAAR
jgi:hypothetical protein